VTAHDDDDLHGLLLDLVRSITSLHVVGAEAGGQIPLSEVLALHELDDGDGLTQQDLALRLHLDKSTVSRLVAGLEQRGLVVRERDPGNRRFVRLSLTTAGRRAHRDLAAVLHDRQREVVAAMSAAERKALRTGLTALLRAMRHPAH